MKLNSQIKTGAGLNKFTPKKLLTRLLVLLAQIKARNNSYRLKNGVIKNPVSFLSIQ